MILLTSLTINICTIILIVLIASLIQLINYLISYVQLSKLMAKHEPSEIAKKRFKKTIITSCLILVTYFICIINLMQFILKNI